jgi:hypothetical protein
MKLLFIVMTTLCLSKLYAADKCANLSHTYKLGAGVIHFKQLDCNTVERETYLNGEAMGDKVLLTISDSWNVIKVDDEYELLTNQQRWMWNKDRTKIIHEFVVDSIAKFDSSRDFMSGSDIYELSDSNIKKTSVKLRRKESSVGQIELKADSKSELLEKLN